MPAQNSRSIVIRGGAIGGGAFFFASTPAQPEGRRLRDQRGPREPGNQRAPREPREPEPASSLLAFVAAGRALVRAQSAREWTLEWARERLAPEQGASLRTPWLRADKRKLKSPVDCWFCLVLREE